MHFNKLAKLLKQQIKKNKKNIYNVIYNERGYFGKISSKNKIAGREVARDEEKRTNNRGGSRGSTVAGGYT